MTIMIIIGEVEGLTKASNMAEEVTKEEDITKETSMEEEGPDKVTVVSKIIRSQTVEHIRETLIIIETAEVGTIEAEIGVSEMIDTMIQEEGQVESTMKRGKSENHTKIAMKRQMMREKSNNNGKIREIWSRMGSN